MSTSNSPRWPTAKLMGTSRKNQRSTSVWVSLCSKYWSAITLFTLTLAVFRKVTVCVSVEDRSNPVHRTAINTQIHFIHTGKLWIFTGITAQSHLLHLDNVTTSADCFFPPFTHLTTSYSSLVLNSWEGVLKEDKVLIGERCCWSEKKHTLF